MRRVFALVSVLVCLLIVGCAQDAVPTEILARTWLIKNGNKYGSAFAVEHKGMAYLVTARHMVEGLPPIKAKIEVWQDDTWRTLQTVKTLFPKSDAVDIAVLKLDEKISKPYEITSLEKSGGVTLGQQLWFLGYPYELGNQFGSQWNGGSPFVKRGTMSAIDGRDPNAVVIYIDGFNNPGFSGGPIVYWDFTVRKYRILGVVKGYRPESAKIEVNGQPVDTQLMVNSGILIAYSIVHANEAIETDDQP